MREANICVRKRKDAFPFVEAQTPRLVCLVCKRRAGSGVMWFPALGDLVNIERKWPLWRARCRSSPTGTTANKKISVSTRQAVDVTRGVRRGGIFLGVPRSIVRRIDSRNDRKPREDATEKKEQMRGKKRASETEHETEEGIYRARAHSVDSRRSPEKRLPKKIRARDGIKRARFVVNQQAPLWRTGESSSLSRSLPHSM